MEFGLNILSPKQGLWGGSSHATVLSAPGLLAQGGLSRPGGPSGARRTGSQSGCRLQGVSRCDRRGAPTGPDIGHCLEFTSKLCWKNINTINRTAVMQCPTDGSALGGAGVLMGNIIAKALRIIITIRIIIRTVIGAASLGPALRALVPPSLSVLPQLGAGCGSPHITDDSSPAVYGVLTIPGVVLSTSMCCLSYHSQ